MSRLVPLDICLGTCACSENTLELCYIKKTVHDCDFFVFKAVYCGRFIALSLKQFGEYVPQMIILIHH